MKNDMNKGDTNPLCTHLGDIYGVFAKVEEAKGFDTVSSREIKDGIEAQASLVDGILNQSNK